MNVDACGRRRQALTGDARCAEQEERLASEHRHFTDVCTRIEQTFNSNLDELDAAFIEACNKLDASGAENRKAIDLHYTHFTQRAFLFSALLSSEIRNTLMRAPLFQGPTSWRQKWLPKLQPRPE